MKSITLAFVVLSLFMSCSQTPTTTDSVTEDTNTMQEEQLLLDSIGFETKALLAIRAVSDSIIFRHNVAFDTDGKSKLDALSLNDKGFYFKADQKKSRNIVLQLREPMRSTGYLIYISEMNYGYSPDKIAVIKSTDQFDILKYEMTNGLNYDIKTEAIVQKLTEWSTQINFKIIGAGFDFVDAVFLNEPEDMSSFVKDIALFCPDVITQGTGTVERLEVEYRRSNGFYLWWD